MSKRFIDTGIFDDDWFMDLSKEAKLLWIYCITKCDHAGLIKINPKLCLLQTGIKDLNGTIKQLGNRLITVSELLYFIPKFIEFQYPGFPNSKVRQQNSAMDILIKHNLFDKENLTVYKDLPKSYEHGNGNDTVNGNEHEVQKQNPKLDFIQPLFIDSFELWLKYKKDRRESYKSEMSTKEAYNRLIKLSDNNPEIATLIVKQSIANNYAGLFELKNKKSQSNEVTDADFE